MKKIKEQIRELFNSVKIKLFLTLSLTILAIIIFLIIVNNFALEKFYLFSKEQTLKSVYEQLNEYYKNSGSEEDFEQELEKIEQDYFIFSTKKYEDNKYSEADLLLYMELIKQHFYQDGIINCPYIEDNNIVDNLLLIPKTIINI